MDKSNLTEQEALYLEAKESYYAGEPIMSDDEFDRLEEDLKQMGSSVIKVVGFVDRTLKHEHPSPMLSLSKAQSTVDGKLPLDQMEKWFSTFPAGIKFESTPKFDGNAANAIYVDGKLKIVISRGNGKKGRDITQKLRTHLPTTIPLKGTVEVRGEVVLPTKAFYQKYSKDFKNPRNLVAGILNRDDLSMDVIADITFMAIEVRIHDALGYHHPQDSMETIHQMGFNTRYKLYKYEFVKPNTAEFITIFERMKEHREKESPFQLDGFVIKAQEDIRSSMGETSHHPEWAIAVKFPPKEAVTRITGYKWNVGTTGAVTPIATLEPVDLDGSTIRNVAAFNLGYIVKNDLKIGSQVSIAKSGDIIPQIVKVISVGKIPYEYPHYCPACGEPTQAQEVQLMCTNDSCSGKLFKRFLVGIRVLRLDKFGGVTCKDLYDAGYTTVRDIFDPKKFNETELIRTGMFKRGKTLSSLIEEVDKVKSIPLARVILALQFSKCGSTASKQIAKLIRGQQYSFSGLEKIAVEGFNPGEKKRLAVEEFIAILESRGVRVVDEVDTAGTIGFEMTGKPPSS
jgi:DNA ligase (NAD+)